MTTNWNVVTPKTADEARAASRTLTYIGRGQYSDLGLKENYEAYLKEYLHIQLEN